MSLRCACEPCEARESEEGEFVRNPNGVYYCLDCAGNGPTCQTHGVLLWTRCACESCSATSEDGLRFYSLTDSGEDYLCQNCVNFALDASLQQLCLTHHVPPIRWGRERLDCAGQWYRYGRSEDGRCWREYAVGGERHIEEVG